MNLKIKIYWKKLSFKERQNIFIQNSFSSHEVLVESTKYDQCDVLKNKIDDLQNILDEFTKGINNLNLLLGNRKASHNKDDLGYKPKFRNIRHAHQTSKLKTLKCNYCNENGVIFLYSILLRKTMKVDMNILLHIFIKNIMNGKMRDMSTSSYFCNYDTHEKSSENIYQTNIRGSKIIWVPKVKT